MRLPLQDFFRDTGVENGHCTGTGACHRKSRCSAQQGLYRNTLNLQLDFFILTSTAIVTTP
jgi:hypothetical protein